MIGKMGCVQSGKKQSIQRLIASVVCVLFLAGLLFSAAFVLTHADHEHDHNGPGQNCVTCAYLTAAENLLKFFSIAMAVAALVFGRFSAILSPLKPVGFHADSLTLVHQKIRLNN